MKLAAEVPGIFYDVEQDLIHIFHFHDLRVNDH